MKKNINVWSYKKEFLSGKSKMGNGSDTKSQQYFSEILNYLHLNHLHKFNTDYYLYTSTKKKPHYILLTDRAQLGLFSEKK